MKTIQITMIVFLSIEALSILLYVPRMRFWFEAHEKQRHFKNDNKAKFALIIPARNESKTIKNLFLSINKQSYPKEFFDVHVVVADKNDPTLKIAEEMLSGVKVHVITKQTKKAEAIDGCFKNILREQPDTYDDFIIIDADNVLTHDFVEEMNNALMSGADLIISRKRIKNWELGEKKHRGLMCSCSAMTWPPIDEMGNKAKVKRNYTLALSGQGMLIKANVIKSLGGYPFRSLIEDYEIAVECIRKGYKQYYCEYAQIYAEEAVTHKEYNKRRIRWIKGFAQFRKMYKKEIVEYMKKDRRIWLQNFHFVYGIYPACFMFAINGIALFAYLIVAIVLAIVGNPLFVATLWCALTAFLITYFELFLYGIACMLGDRETNKMTFAEIVAYMFLGPIITMEYIYIFVIAFTTKDFSIWEPVERLDIEIDGVKENRVL